MKLEIRGESLSPVVIDQVDRRLRFALTRFGRRVRKVKVEVGVGALRGPDRDMCCRVVVHLRPPGRIFIENTAPDMQTAIDRAADRVQRAVARAIEHPRTLAGDRIATEDVA